ncbi:MAG TPA: MG2 domain-containing protein [Acidobacteriaceae bacterium]|nr:MG2 domain-containing protein [Acidobacteriaceae bacterium]
MRPRFVSLLFVCLFAVTGRAQQRPASFNLSTNKTFAPGEQPKIHLYSRNVDALEFRVYRVNDPVKFLENLRELHSFGPEAGLMPREQIDERTWLEKFHDWKDSIWESIRRFFRSQFSRTARTSLRTKQSSIERHSRIVSEAEFAQIPILNSSQLVARWRQLVPPTYISDNNVLPVQKLKAGLYLVEATNGHLKAYTLLMITQMALVTRTTSAGVTTFVVDRTTGQPIGGANVEDGFGQKSLGTALTDTQGVAQLSASSDAATLAAGDEGFWVVAHKGDDFAASTPATWALTYDKPRKYEGYVFTERPVYRPTHTVHWKAILREHSGNILVLPKAKTAHVSILDGQDKAVFQRDMPISAAGDITGDFELPRDASLGYYTLRVGDENENVSTSFHVEDYRKPEYRVSVAAAQKRTLEGSTMPVTIDSRYFFGEPVANGKVKYRIYHERLYWYGDEGDEESSAPPDENSDEDNAYSAGDEEQEKTAKLDANGLLTVQVPTQVTTDAANYTDLQYTVEAGVTDAANREISGRGRFMATYSTFRVMVEPVMYSVRVGESAKFKVTTKDYENKPVSTHVHVQLAYQHWEGGHSKTVDGPATDLTTDATGHATGELPVGSNPPYRSALFRATASAVQPGTRDPHSEGYLWIMGANEEGWGGETQNAEILADKKSYAPGDTAHLTIVSPALKFYALLLVEGSTLERRELLHSDSNSVSYDLPITAESQPNLTVSVLFLKDSTLYQASNNLKVPPKQQQLQVQVTPAKDVFQPNQQVSYDVLTRDSGGKPTSADISFGVVDEAIYSLHPDSSGDMVKALYPDRYINAQVDSSLDYFFSGEAGVKSPMLAMRNARFRPQLAQVKPGNEAKPRVRKAFPDTAYWASSIHTDSSGHARVSFTFPDSLTTWRTTVHAITADSKAGSSINRVLVRKNVLVRMGSPRFMIEGDEITLPVIVHNYLLTPKQTMLSLKVEGLDTVAGAQQSVSVPSRGEATVSWRLRAGHVGTAKLTASALTGEESDALEISFPVQATGVPKTLPKSGVIPQSGSTASADIAFPSGTDPAAHSLRIEVSPSIAGTLFSALDYLTTYPYGCTEQTMSSFLPNVVVAETLNRLNVNGRIDQADLNAKTAAAIARLKDYQHDDGGWGWWKEDESRVDMTAYVVSGLGLARQTSAMSSDNAQGMMNRGVQYLRNQLAAHPHMRPELRAAVVYALAMAGETQLGSALDGQWARRNDLQPEALAMTGLAMLQVHDRRAAQVAELLSSKAIHQGELVHWRGKYLPMLDLEYSDDAEATAYAMRLLAKVNPSDPLLSAAAQWLVLSRDAGLWWGSTEQTAMVLFGLVDYLAASHELEADYTINVLVNGESIGKHHFTSSDAVNGASFKIELGANQLHAGTNRVELVRDGGMGRVYWSARGQYYSTAKSDFQSGTMSLNLTRDYFKLSPMQKDGRIVYALQPFDGTAQIGDVVAVHEAINGSPQRYLLVEDPIPAGAEFVTNQESYEIDHRPGGWFDWFTREEFHDDHAAFFADDFSGRQEIFYLIRIVNPGSFQVSPASVEPMYEPSVQATTDVLHLQVAASAGGVQ